LFPDDHQLELIQTIEERTEKLKEFGLNHLIIFPFTKEFSRLSPLEFIRDVLVNEININTLVIGYDHHFGRNREGNINLIKELAPVYEFSVEEVPAFALGSENISSTKIRNFIKSGEIKKANEFLSHPFLLRGKVIKGDKIGTSIDFPTANIQIKEDYKIIPKKGVYAVFVLIKNKQFSGMLNIGNRPTIGIKGENRIEVHIFDFSELIYDEEITIELIDYIREEKEFENLNHLKEQLKKDENKIRNILSKHFAFN